MEFMHNSPPGNVRPPPCKGIKWNGPILSKVGETFLLIAGNLIASNYLKWIRFGGD